MNWKISPRHALFALLLSFGASGPLLAAPPDCCPPGGVFELRAGHVLRELSRLHDELKLNPQQEALWQEASRFSREGMDAMRTQMRGQRAAALSMLSQPNADLRAIAAQMDEAREAGRKQREANRERWLQVYDSLDAVQKEQARLFVKSRIERMEGGGRFDRPRR